MERKFKKELSLICDEVNKKNIIINEIIKKTKNKTGEQLRKATVAYYMQEIENRILETIYMYIYIYYTNINIIHDMASLCYDGIMVLRENYNNNLPNEFSKEI